MLKTLIKKQFQEVLGSMLQRQTAMGKKGNSKGKIVLFAFLMLYCIVVFCGLFYSMMGSIVEAFVPAGLGWLAFSLAGIMATMLGVIGSIFATQSQLFDAKDNELLLSMPIKPSKILFCRMLVLYVQVFIYESVVFIPAYVAYCQAVAVGFEIISFVIFLLVCLLLPMFGLAISCVLGWLVAIISSKMKRKTMFSVVLSLVFFAVYFYIMSQINTAITKIIENSSEISGVVKTAFYPFYKMGEGMDGNVLSLVIFAAIVVILFMLIYYVLSRSFIKIATTRKGGVKVKYKEKSLKTNSVNSSLFKRELKHFFGSAPYLLNCGLGAVIIIVGAVYLVIKGPDLFSMFNELFDNKSVIVLIALGIISYISCTDVTTAPSISIEGHTLWIVQSLPIDLKAVLASKIKLHMLINAIPTALISIVISVVAGLNILDILLMLVFNLIIVFLNAQMGLVYNLKNPNLDWKNETIAVKQGMSVLLTMLTMWGIVIVMVGIAYAFMSFANIKVGIVIDIIILGVVSYFIMKWLNNTGVKRLAEL